MDAPTLADVQDLMQNIDVNKVARWGGIIAIIIMLCIVFKTTILKFISTVKGFVKRNTPTFNFLYV
jgi:hypothetical protein